MTAAKNLAIVNRETGELHNPNPTRPYAFQSRSHMVVGREFADLASCGRTAL